jgi:hypothetical protein
MLFRHKPAVELHDHVVTGPSFLIAGATEEDLALVSHKAKLRMSSARGFGTVRKEELNTSI